MKKILLIDNFDSFTFNLVDLFKIHNCIVNVARNTISNSEIYKLKPDLIVLSPGPGSPEFAGNMIEIIKEFAAKIPMLGVCLGHQALGLAFGGTLKKISPVHGKVSSIKIAKNNSCIFKSLPSEFAAGRYHSIAIDSLPEEFEILAKSEDQEIMAIKHKEYRTYGIQFHPESILTYKNGIGSKIIKNVIELI